ncbi:MAG: metal-dependent hydrolase [Bryobacteraceae bacterium]|nr:metal-dependent hydrolase [Bryobacteraceae bacterium]
MDNLTHSMTGLLLGRAGLRKFHPQATLILFLAANMPDMDAVSAVGGAANYFQYHRWITHALVSIPVVALIPVLFAWAWRRKEKPQFLAGWVLSMIGVGSHLLLDYTNPYGIRLFLPWDTSWPMLSTTSLIDVWIWAILLTGTLWPMLGRLVSSEIGAKQETGSGLAIVALSLLALYDGGRWVLHEKAVALLDSQMYNGESPLRVHAFPDQLNPLVWQGIVETGAFFIERRVTMFGSAAESQGKVYFKPEASPAITAAAQDPLFRRLAEFSKVLHWSTTPTSEVEGGSRVTAMDLYFGFSASAVVDSRNRVVDSAFEF